MKVGLLIIDLQKAWYNELTKESMDLSCSLVNELIPIFKEKKLPVIYIQHVNEAKGVVPGSSGFEMLDTLLLDEEDTIITKSYGNAFNKTQLKELVDQSGINIWLLAGYRAENCILSTYRGALDLDLTPVLLKHAIAGPLSDHVTFVEAMSESITLGLLKKFLNDK